MLQVKSSVGILFFVIVSISSSLLAFAQSSKTMSPSMNSTVTWAEHIAPMMQQQCMSCHRSGGAAGDQYSMLSYEETKIWADQIDLEVTSRRMPHSATLIPDEACGGTERFDEVRRLTDREINMFHQWIEADMPEGDAKKVPPNPKFPDTNGWVFGQPDVIVSQAKGGFVIPGNLGNKPGESKDMFRNFNLPVTFDQDRYLIGFQIIPGNSIKPASANHPFPPLHHAHLILDRSGTASLAQEKRFQDGEPAPVEPAVGKVPFVAGPGYERRLLDFPIDVIGSWFPGGAPFFFPDGVAQRIPKGSTMIFQIHYTLYNEKDLSDETKLGLYFAKKPIQKVRHVKEAVNEHFLIPANATAHQEHNEVTVYHPAHLISVLPHMHQLGTYYQIDAILPNGEKRCVMSLKWDFEHQTNHVFKMPYGIPAGTKLVGNCTYNNSETNSRQFNHPPKDIPFGPVASQEMCRVDYALTYDDEKFNDQPPKIESAVMEGIGLVLKGQNLTKGALIEINGKPQPATVMGKSGGSLLLTPAALKAAGFKPGDLLTSSILNPDNGRSEDFDVEWKQPEAKQ